MIIILVSADLRLHLYTGREKIPDLLEESKIKDLVAGFQESIITVLVEKTVEACRSLGYKKILISGGVAANSRLRTKFMERSTQEGIKIFIPPISLCMDNAAMVAAVGYREYIEGNFSDYGMDVFSKSDI